jgi:hypothetical protein
MKLSSKIQLALAVLIFAAAGVITFKTATTDRPSLANEHKEVHPPPGPGRPTTPIPINTGVRFASQTHKEI